MTLELQATDLLDGIPQRIRLTLRNTADHDLKLPEPGIQCNGQYGSLWLRVAHTGSAPAGQRAKQAISPPRNCPVQPSNENPKQWITLGPGGYLDRWYSASRLRLQDEGAGLYTLHAEYLPPALSPTLTRSLAAEGIQPPRIKVQSNRLTFTRGTSR